MRKLPVAGIIELIVLALALWLHMVIDYALWCQISYPELWDWREALLNAQLWMAVAQYVAITTAFVLAWLVWHWPGHKLSYILLAWGMTWLPMAFVSRQIVRACRMDPRICLSPCLRFLSLLCSACWRLW